jgi:two-component system, sensor histidine kinase and response regulator
MSLLPLVIGGSATLHQAGISAYLTKPVRQSRLYNCIVAVARAVPCGDSPKSSEKSDPDEPQGFPGTQVLLAEDNPVNQVVAQHMLKGLGCRVEVVSNGQDAVEALSNVPFDLVLMDSQMPVLDGYAATRIIREKEAQDAKDPPQPRQGIRRIPIVALTAHAMQGDRERCIAAGMDDYLSKPFNLDGDVSVKERFQRFPQNPRRLRDPLQRPASAASVRRSAGHS